MQLSSLIVLLALVARACSQESDTCTGGQVRENACGRCTLEVVQAAIRTCTRPTQNCTTNLLINTETCCPACSHTVSGDNTRDTTCTEAQITECRRNPPDACATGTSPVREGCCISCSPVSVSCTEETLRACNFSALPVCVEGTVRTLVNCCPSCRPPRTESACTEEAFAACRETTGDCQTGETPVRVANSCCLSCRRPTSTCAAEQITQALREAPECTGTERPALVRDENLQPTCTLSCRPPRPTCTPACAETEICVPARNATTRCLPRQSHGLRLRVRAAVRARVANWTSADWENFLQEVLNRFCENPANADRCERHRQRIDALRVRILEKLNAAGEVRVAAEANADEQDAAADRKRQASDDFGTFVATAANDQNANSGTVESAEAVPEEEEESGVARATLAATLALAGVVASLL